MIQHFTITSTAYCGGNQGAFQRLARQALQTRHPIVGNFVNANTGVQKNYLENYSVFDTMPIDGCMDRGGSLSSSY